MGKDYPLYGQLRLEAMDEDLKDHHEMRAQSPSHCGSEIRTFRDRGSLGAIGPRRNTDSSDGQTKKSEKIPLT